MKLISWNVNGIRACVQKGFLEFFQEADADIFCTVSYTHLFLRRHLWNLRTQNMQEALLCWHFLYMHCSHMAEQRPVSYTHLDVYKRQNESNKSRWKTCRFWERFLGAVAVSYTHLFLFVHSTHLSLVATHFKCSQNIRICFLIPTYIII